MTPVFDDPVFDDEPRETPVVRDKRRLDPETGLRREGVPDLHPASGTAADGGGSGAGPGKRDVAGGDNLLADVERQLAERTDDLKRLQAEYVNYKKRVDRDREVTRQNAIGSVVGQLLPVLDDIGRAREHGELVGGFRAVAESLERAVDGLGLVAYGAVGDPFDPYLHDALTHTYSDDVDGPTCVHVMQVGYRIGDRILRPARVGVAEPQPQPHPDAVSTDAESEPDPNEDPAEVPANDPVAER